MAKRVKKSATCADELDTLLLHSSGLAVGCRAQGPDEPNIDFKDRVIAEFGDIIVRCEGSIDLAALIFGMDDGLLRDLVSVNPHLKSQWQRAKELPNERQKRAEDAAAEFKEEMIRLVNPDRFKAKRTRVWPTNPKQRRRQIIKLLTQGGAMNDYNGSTIQMAKPLQLTPEELDEVIQSDPELVRLQRIAQAADDAAAERNLIVLAATGSSPTAAMKVLTNRHPDKYSDKQQIDVKNTGFSAPEAMPESILFKEKEKCDED